MNDICLLIAHDQENPALLPRHLTDRLQVTGVGFKMAQDFMYRLLAECRPKQIIVLGHCGSVRDDVPIGTVLIAESCCYLGERLMLKPNERFVAKIRPAVRTEFAVYETFPSVVTTRNNVAKDTEAVDMESFFLAKIAGEHKVPIIVAKTVGDIVPKSPVDAIIGKLTGKRQFQPSNFSIANFYSSIFVQNYVDLLGLKTKTSPG